MPLRDIITIGASAGGIRVLREVLLPALPRDFPAAVFVLVHRALKDQPGASDYLPNMLAQGSRLPVVTARDGDPFAHGHVYLAPAGQKMCIEAERVRIEPSSNSLSLNDIDAMFRSAANSHGPRVAAVVLSGMLKDGTAGLWDVRARDGITIVQDPREAEQQSMPTSAMHDVGVHHCLKAAEIGPLLIRLATDEQATAVGRRPRVLIVEDERIVAASLEKRLSALGYDVVGSVASGREVLELAPRVAPDIVLMDIQLAGPMKGTEAARLLWEERQIPIVFLTAYSDESTVSEAKSSMPYGFIVKPYGTSEVHAAIQLALDKCEREREH